MKSIQKLKLLVDELKKRAEHVSSQEEQIKELIPEAVEALVENNRIYEHQKEAAAASMTDHAACIKMLTNLAAHRNEFEAGFAPEKTAGTKRVLIDSPISDFDQTDAGRKFREKIAGF